MSANNPKTVKLQVYDHNGYREGVAGEDNITPGMLLDIDGDGDLIKHDDAGENAVPYIAVENDYIGDDIDEDYNDEDQIRYHIGITGERYYMWLQDGENVSEGDFLESAGDGTLQEHVLPEDTDGGTTGDIHTQAARFIAKEDVNADQSENERIIVEVA